jgi:RNA polymerase sigma factor (sigma-70 family)
MKADNATAVPAQRRDRVSELYATSAPHARALAFALTGDRALAEDLAQEAFVRSIGRFRHLREPSAFEGYLRRVVVNLARAHFRRVQLERLYTTRSASDAPRHTDLKPHDAELWSEVLKLPYRQRAAIVLRFYEDLSEHQTAQLLRCSERAVNSLVSRATASLRARLEGQA